MPHSRNWPHQAAGLPWEARLSSRAPWLRPQWPGAPGTVLGAEAKTNFGSMRVVGTPSDKTCQGHRVQTTTLDDALARLHESLSEGQRQGRGPHRTTTSGAGASRLPQVHVAAIKMDVQGHEAHVLDGARTLLASSPPDQLFIETANHSLVRALVQRGYTQSQTSKPKDGCDNNVRLERHGIHFS